MELATENELRLVELKGGSELRLVELVPSWTIAEVDNEPETVVPKSVVLLSNVVAGIEVTDTEEPLAPKVTLTPAPPVAPAPPPTVAEAPASMPFEPLLMPTPALPLTPADTLPVPVA